MGEKNCTFSKNILNLWYTYIEFKGSFWVTSELCSITSYFFTRSWPVGQWSMDEPCFIDINETDR